MSFLLLHDDLDLPIPTPLQVAHPKDVSVIFICAYVT